MACRPHEFEELVPPRESLDIGARAVARLAQCGPDNRWNDAVEAAISEARALADPRARWVALGASDLDGLFPGGTPIEIFAQRGDAYAFIATIGNALEERVKAYFDEPRYLEGVLLDAAGSIAADGLCDLVEAQCVPGRASMRFSPGYCHWQLTAQHRIFEILEPSEIGIELMPSLLMNPLKSVSGIVIRGAPEDLKVPKEICEQCEVKGCTRRQGRAPATKPHA